MSTIKNGMTVRVCKYLEVPKDLKHLQNTGRHIKLVGGKDNTSGILEDGSVMIKGLGYFEKQLFEPVEMTVKEPYEVIIHTQNVFEQGGSYQRYDNVLEHSEEAHGVRVVTKSGEWFHPWSFDGGIRAVYTPSSH